MSQALQLFHFSDKGDIDKFVPRSPIRHPEKAALVYAIDAWHSPLYLFPRDCPRIGLWLLPTTTPEDREAFQKRTSGRMLLLIDSAFEQSWRSEPIYKYEFDPEGFEDQHDFGMWTSQEAKVPMSCDLISDLPAACEAAGVEVRAVSDLGDAAGEFYAFGEDVFKTTLHVSMVRMGLLPHWPGSPAWPVKV